jgi:hypothetical protein
MRMYCKTTLEGPHKKSSLIYAAVAKPLRTTQRAKDTYAKPHSLKSVSAKHTLPDNAHSTDIMSVGNRQVTTRLHAPSCTAVQLPA